MPIRNSRFQWNFPELIPVPGDFQLAVGGSSLVAKTLYRRGLTSPAEALAFLNPDLYSPALPSALDGLPLAADRIIKAIQLNERILVWGDFDVDGQTSTTLLVSSLRELGAHVQHHIPIRSEESHGVSVPVLADIIQQYSPHLIVTCDTGIDAFDAVEYANNAGIHVIITDHHQLPPSLPDAYAIVNPNTLPTDHALYYLPGVGVAFKLIEAVYSNFSKDTDFLLDLVALGIVADVATQTGDTRYLLQKGLEILRNTPRLSLLEVFRRNNLEPSQITEDHIGFVIAPRLNALGRLDDANSCVEFFTTDDPGRASELASRLEELNKNRQILTEEIFQDAENMIAAYPELADEYPILVLQGSPQWHPGVIGIVASRLVERYQKPVIMLSQDGGEARGSARSIPGVPISDLIGSASELLTSYGGHPMAAGLSLPLINVSQFRRVLAEKYLDVVGHAEPDVVIQIDAEITFNDIQQGFINDFMRLAPFGAGNPKLTFATRGVYSDDTQIKTIGRSGNHRKITFTDSNNDQNEFLWWNSADLSLPPMPLDICYSLELSTFRDQTQVQSTLLHLRQCPDSPVYIPAPSKIELIDLRKDGDPLAEVANLFTPNSSLIWAESDKPSGLPSAARSQLTKCDRLFIWTSPPNNLVLTQAIKKSSPKEIVFIGVNPPIDSLDTLIQSLLGLLKHLQNTNKPLDLIRFAEVLAQPIDVVEIGIEWIHKHGDYDLSRIAKGVILPGPRANLPGFAAADTMLKHMLREVLAYRTYFNNAHIRAIL